MPPEIFEGGIALEEDSHTFAPGPPDKPAGVAIGMVELYQIGRGDFEIGAQRSTIEARIFEVALDEHAEDVDGTSAINDHPHILTRSVRPQDLLDTR